MTRPELLRQVNALRRTDNWTNWLYLAREYLFLVLVIGLTIAFYRWVEAAGTSRWYDLPVTFLAIGLIGGGQHRLTTLAHEASHYLLFRNRRLNELVSDWLCMFPMWSTTHHYRIQHLAHHQFPNDPQRDPDVAQMEGSGHRFGFPMSPRRFIWECVVKQFLWLPGLVRYVRMRARYASGGTADGPYASQKASRVVILVGLLYVLGLAATLTTLAILHQEWALAVVPAALWAIIVGFYVWVPESFYSKTRVRPDVSMRWITVGRMTYFTLTFTALAWLSHWTGEPWGLYYIVLWMVPLATSFAFFMVARQIVQHGNAGGDRFTNTRVFLVGRLLRWAVFPIGMDYHLPHHLFPLVPHYRLRRLHELLWEGDPEYRAGCTVVEGYFFHRRPPKQPTVLEVMAAPGAAPKPMPVVSSPA